MVKYIDVSADMLVHFPFQRSFNDEGSLWTDYRNWTSWTSIKAINEISFSFDVEQKRLKNAALWSSTSSFRLRHENKWTWSSCRSAESSPVVLVPVGCCGLRWMMLWHLIILRLKLLHCVQVEVKTFQDSWLENIQTSVEGQKGQSLKSRVFSSASRWSSDVVLQQWS